MGNICRSPTAEGVFRKKLEQAGLSERVLVDSAGTHAYHVGDPPDARSTAAALKRGYDISEQRARQLSTYDAERFDLVIAMDQQNRHRIVRLFGGDEPSADQRASVRMMLEFANQGPKAEVPDPYTGGPAGFEHVLDLLEEAADGLLEEVKRRLKV